ncbi:MAG: HypC/HybG/HupF family hydrogenase formation chaperone [Candidatus Omnitrophica bacterium]|nr:HypC/HybG/HupF family hydrogenase formation chaperone [Candidatus Omnitrophota bacterium]MBU1925535.1 HypC/HybG/HupF family hydrogenase formation chaperone [Candidatus Omnitrophota bacterium]
MCLGVPVKIEKIEGKTAIVSAGGARKKIGIELTPGVKSGDYVLLHAGFAIQKISEEEAKKTLELFEEMYKRLAE